MKPNYAEKTNSSGKFVLIIVSKWVSSYFLFSCICLFKLVGKFSRLLFAASMLLGFDSLTIHCFLRSSLFKNKLSFLKISRIYNQINPTIIKIAALFAVSTYLSKIQCESVKVSTFKSVLSPKFCNDLYVKGIFISNEGKSIESNTSGFGI